MTALTTGRAFATFLTARARDGFFVFGDNATRGRDPKAETLAWTKDNMIDDDDEDAK